MQIIRDEELGGLLMIPLFHQWHIKRCNVKGCKNVPTTILLDPAEGWNRIGMCEEHYQEAMALTDDDDQDKSFKIEADDFDAFEYNKITSSTRVIYDDENSTIKVVEVNFPKPSLLKRVKMVIDKLLPEMPLWVQIVVLWVAGFLFGSLLYEIVH